MEQCLFRQCFIKIKPLNTNCFVLTHGKILALIFFNYFKKIFLKKLESEQRWTSCAIL